MRILLVDDSPDVANMLKNLMERVGHQVRCAYTGREALAVAAEFSPQAVCVDLGLPDMTGYQLAARLRHEAGLAEVRIVALTGSPPEPDKLEQAGIDGHMLKPAKIADILQAMTEPK